jgi:nicotinic acid mononucleotide adenylyltransferase
LPASSFEVRIWLLRNPAGEASPFYLLPGLHIEISASRIRDLIHDRIRDEAQLGAESTMSTQQLLPRAVMDYIQSHKLYR